jgi:hypothetical protein
MDERKKKELIETAFDPSKEKNLDTKKLINVPVEDEKEIEHPLPEEGSFKRYEESIEIAKKIAKELITNDIYKKPVSILTNSEYTDIIKNGLTYFMSSGSGQQERTGLLSIAPALLTAMKIWQELTKKESSLTTKEKSNKDKLLENIKTGIDAMFNIIYRVKDWRNAPKLIPVFDASPFEYEGFSQGKDDEGLNGKSYIDSISWAVPVFLQILNMENIKTKENEEAFVFDKSLREQSKILAKWCLEYVSDCIVCGKNEEHLGWSFTKLDKNVGEKFAQAERSLYFTYAVSTIYLSFYIQYKKYIDALRILDEASSGTGGYAIKSFEFKLHNKYWNDKNDMVRWQSVVSEELKKKVKEINDLKLVCEELRLASEKLKKNIKELSENERRFEERELEENELDRKENEKKGKEKELEDKEEFVYKLEKIQEALEVLCEPNNAEKIDSLLVVFNNNNRINSKINDKAKGKSETKEIGQLSSLKFNLQLVAKDIWDIIKDKLEENFFYEDIKSTIAETAAMEKGGGQTNALFTGLLQIGIILNCAYDDEIRKVNQDEYEKMQGAMLLHVQKTQRFFDKLEKEGRSIVVDSLILRFMEKINENIEKKDKEKRELSDSELAEVLMKANIKVCSLTPMLLKTNSLLSEYVIKYPQKQMGESLLLISKKRRFESTKEKDDPFRWFWETDGYHAISNYYYVGAVFDFYAYYEKYEEAYVRRYKKMRDHLLDDNVLKKGAKKFYQEFLNEKKDLEKKHTEKMDELKKEYDKQKAIANDNVLGGQLVTIIEQVIVKSTFGNPDFLKNIIIGIRKQLAKELVERYKKYIPEEKKEYLVELEEPIALKDDGLFSLMQALFADVILNSAIAYKRKSDNTGDIESFSQNDLKKDGIQSAEYSLIGRKQLINDGLIGRLFSLMFKLFNWTVETDKNFQKKEDK